MIPLQFLTDIFPVIYDKNIVWDPAKRILQVGCRIWKSRICTPVRTGIIRGWWWR